MPGLRNLAGGGALIACLFALSILPACGGNEFASGGSGGGGEAGSAGGSGGGNGGLGGTLAGSGGAGEAGQASGGSAGGGPMSCRCPAGSYCLDASTDCSRCSSLNRLRFGSPERLTSISNMPRYPRAGGTGTDLLYQVTGLGLRYTTDSSTSAGSMVPQTTAQDAAPLLLATDVTSLADTPFNFVFDREVMDRRELLLGQWRDGALDTTERAPAPFNDDASSNYGLAIASAPPPGKLPRAYWLSDRPVEFEPVQPPQLFTALMGDGSEAAHVRLTVGACTVPSQPSSAFAPWVTPDGSALFFSHDGACLPPITPDEPAADLDLYAAWIATATGQPANSASLLQDVNSAANDQDPSFSSDLCELYFASDRDGELALYRARRR